LFQGKFGLKKFNFYNRWTFKTRTKEHDPHVKAYFQHLVDNGKLPLQTVCAVMRKLLHAIHGMLKHNQPFDNTRFYAIPISEDS
jgi:hypothetical protein